MTWEQSGWMNWLGWVLPVAVALATATTGCSSDGSSGKPDESSQTSGGSAGMARMSPGNPTSGAALISAPDVCQTALACENFDTLPVDAAPGGGAWTTLQNLGSVRVDTTHAYSGTQAVK